MHKLGSRGSTGNARLSIHESYQHYSKVSCKTILKRDTVRRQSQKFGRSKICGLSLPFSYHFTPRCVYYLSEIAGEGMSNIGNGLRSSITSDKLQFTPGFIRFGAAAFSFKGLNVIRYETHVNLRFEGSWCSGGLSKSRRIGWK